MSLNIYLERKRLISYDDGKTHTEDNEEVYWANITHNLREMADKAEIYEALWRPEEIAKIKASEIIEILEKGLIKLKEKPEYFYQFNAKNGWGKYENLVSFVEQYLAACNEFPDATIRVSR